MYKIYFGNRYLLIADKSINNSANVFSFNAINDLQKCILHFDRESVEPFIIITSDNPEKVFSQIIKMFTFIEAAGGVVKNENDDIFMIYRYNKWDLPKGKREKNEKIEQCALREVEEECGINGHYIIRPLSSTFHTFHHNNDLCFKQVFWFEMKYKGDQICTPQLEEDITQVVWASRFQLPTFLLQSYPSIVDTIKSIESMSLHSL